MILHLPLTLCWTKLMSSNVIKENRLSLWYNKYKYKAVIDINGVYPVSFCNTFQDYYNRVDSYGWHNHVIPKYHSGEIMAYYDWKGMYGDTVLITVGGNKITVFGDNLLALNSLITITGVKPVITEAFVYATGEKGVKYFKTEPKHKYRVYLNSIKVDDSVIDNLFAFIGNNEYYPCLSLKLWVNRRLTFKNRTPASPTSSLRFTNPTVWARQSFFIDFDEEDGDVTLRLMFDSLINNKIYRLAKQP